MNRNPILFIDAAMAHFESKRREALATLELYITSPVGISDHSNILDEIVKWTKVLTESEECIDTLKRNVRIDNDSPQVITEVTDEKSKS